MSAGGQVVVTGNVHKVAALLYAQLWFQLIPEPRFMGCDVEWNMPEQTPKGWCLTTSSPEASTLLPILKLPGHCSLLWFLGVHCQEAGFQLGLQVQATWFRVTLPCRAHQRNGLLCLVCTGDSVPSQGKPDDPFQRGLTEDTLHVCRLLPSQSIPGTQPHSGSSHGITDQVREVGGSKWTFLFFPLTLYQCYVEAQLMCSFALILSVQCTDSCMIYTHTQHECAWVCSFAY